jgi:hypothetical protein
MKKAEEKVCKCPTQENHVFLNVVPLTDHELESLDQFYCTKCNSFWKEP